MQTSGHIHTLSASSPGNKEFVPVGNRVNTRASLNGAEKRKISMLVPEPIIPGIPALGLVLLVNRLK